MYETKDYIIKSLDKGIRLDGRKETEYREIKLDYNVSANAEGSARVKIGDTEVIAGIKLSVGEPYPDTPDEGSLMVEAELLPMSNPEFESGPPGIQAVELSRVVDRGIREAKAIDVKKLCIKEGEKVWFVSIDICIINDAGNLFDAATLAALAALKVTRFPSYDGVKIDYKNLTEEKLPLLREPVGVTVAKIGKYFIVDPTPKEERALDARLTVTTTTDKMISALQKGGEATLMLEDIDKMVQLGIEKGSQLRKFL